MHQTLLVQCLLGGNSSNRQINGVLHKQKSRGSHDFFISHNQHEINFKHITLYLHGNLSTQKSNLLLRQRQIV